MLFRPAFTYTVKTLAGVDIFGTSTAPVNVRTAKCEYSAGTKGLAYILADGSFEFVALDEIVTGDVVDLVVRTEFSGGTLVNVTKKFTVLEAGTTETNTNIADTEESEVTSCGQTPP